MRSLGIYIHIPYCAKKCAYCDFYSVPSCETSKAYCNALIKQIESQLIRKQLMKSENSLKLMTM